MKVHFLSFIAIVTELCGAASLPKYSGQGDCNQYEFDITWDIAAPDGFARRMILVNGKSPGQEIHVKQGDCVEVSSVTCIHDPPYLVLRAPFLHRWWSTIRCNWGRPSISTALSESMRAPSWTHPNLDDTDSMVLPIQMAFLGSRRKRFLVGRASRIYG